MPCAAPGAGGALPPPGEGASGRCGVCGVGSAERIGSIGRYGVCGEGW